MSQQRKISIRKVIQTLVTFIVVAGCTVAMLSADRLQNSRKVRTVSITVRNSNKVHFLDSAQVMNLLFTDRHIDPQSTPVARLDVHKLEAIARSNPWVSDAQVYIDNEREVHVFVTQRVPVARIFEDNGNSYYIDTSLRAMPVSTTYVHYTPVVTGLQQLRDDSAGRARKGEILSLINYVSNHPFWNAQIAQIVMADDKSIELIPVLGKQRILMGDTSRMDEKFGNLFAFYQQVCNKVGWDKYEIVDLRYKDQVVASPTIKWKIPVDRALSNMNWVKAVLESGNKNEKDESAITDATTAPAATPAVPAPAPRPAIAPASVKPQTMALAAAAKSKAPHPAAKPAAKAPKPHSANAAKPKKLTPAGKPVKKETKPAKKAETKPIKKPTAEPKKPAAKNTKKSPQKSNKNATNH